MLKEIERKFVLTQGLLLGFFAWGVGFLYLVSTISCNAVQLHWQMFGFAWEALAFGVPLIAYRPMMRSIRRYAHGLESGASLSPEQAAIYYRKILAYPFKVALEVFLVCNFAYVLGAFQVRYFARLPWEGVGITLICGVTTALLWGVLEYFLLEYDLRPLTELAASAAHGLPSVPQRVSLRVKIFVSSLALVVASLSFFGVIAYTRAARILEDEVGQRLSGRMRELANLIGALPTSPDGSLSVAWRFLAAEFPISPRGYFHIVDRAGQVVATHPDSGEAHIQRFDDEPLLPAVRTRIVDESEGYLVDHVDENKIVSYVNIPGTRWKIVAIAPRRDFSSQLDQVMYSGLAGMAFAIVLSLGIGMLCARGITTPLGEVTRAARRVAENRDLTQRVAFVTNDEVGVLAHAFNHMTEGLQTYADELEDLVTARTQELESKNAELSDFLYVASHDLRAPLINLAGFSHVLQDSMSTLERLMERVRGSHNGTVAPALAEWPSLKEDIAESINFILRSTAKMDVLVTALLELSRIETRPHVQQPIDTRKLVDDIFGAFHFQISERKIAVSTGVLPVVTGDPVRINQVFSNLIDNAIKYMRPQGDKHIEVGCVGNGGHHHFFVRDTGLGIRPEDQATVFRLFARVGNNGVTGDGVGLAAVRKIVEKHGGKIWVESEPGKGSTFWFTLPRHTGEDAAGVAGNHAAMHAAHW